MFVIIINAVFLLSSGKLKIKRMNQCYLQADESSEVGNDTAFL